MHTKGGGDAGGEVYLAFQSLAVCATVDGIRHTVALFTFTEAEKGCLADEQGWNLLSNSSARDINTLQVKCFKISKLFCPIFILVHYQ